MTTISITPDLLDAAGINPETWRRVVDLTGDDESGRMYRGGWALRRLRSVLDVDQEVSQ